MESIKFPVGRIMQGSVNKLNPVIDKKTNTQKVYAKGAKIGQPRFDCFFAIAIAKNPGETHFGQSEWGAKLWAIGNRDHPKFAQGRNFAWKITDGDSAEPDGNGVKPNSREGWPGHWIVKFNNSEIPRLGEIVNGKFTDLVDPNKIKPGFFVEVVADVEGNGIDNESPGIYINHKLVCFRFFGPEISYGPNPDEFEFGTSAAPVGASTVPLATPSLPGAPASTGLPSLPGAPASTGLPSLPGAPASTGIPPLPGAPASTGIPPLPGAPASTGIPPLPGAPAPTVPVKTMTAKAGAYTYDQYVASGYTDAQLIEQGFMLAPVTPNVNYGSVTGIIPPAPPAPVKNMTALAGTFTYEQYMAQGYTDDMLIKMGYMTIQ